jgi:hypothetical protein
VRTTRKPGRAFRQALDDNVSLPADAFVIGEPVSVVGIDDDGRTRCGLIAKCRRADARQHSREARIVANALPMEVLR